MAGRLRLLTPFRRYISGLSSKETIYALSSAPGKAGVSVIRISGPETFPAVKRLTQSSDLPKPRYAALRKLSDPTNGSLLDEALVLTFPEPASFTGEVSLDYSF